MAAPILPTSNPNADLYAALAIGGLGAGSSILNNRAQSNLNAANRRQRFYELLSGLNTDQLNENFRGQQANLNSTQLDPYAQARAGFSAGILRDKAFNGAPHVGRGGVTNPFNAGPAAEQFLNNNALAENASRFFGAAGSLNPDAQIPNLAEMGLGDAGIAHQGGLNSTIAAAGADRNFLQNQRRQDLINGLTKDQQGGGGGGWRKYLSLASLAIPFIGPAIGGALGLAGTLGSTIGSGLAGAGIGAASGGLSGAAYGGAGGALSGYMNNGGRDYFNRPAGSNAGGGPSGPNYLTPYASPSRPDPRNPPFLLR